MKLIKNTGNDRVIDEMHQTLVPLDAPSAEEASFLASLAISGLPCRDLFALYQGWIDRVAVLEAAKITGSFILPDSADHASVLRDGLDAYTRLQRDVTVLRAQATKEKQLSRLVDLNLEIKRLETELATVTERL